MMNSSKRKKRTKAAAAGAVLLAVMLAATACGGDNSNKTGSQSPDATNNPPQQVEDLPDGSGMVDPDVEGSDNTDTDNNATNDGGGNASEGDTNAPETKSDKGTFTGIVDTHSIEIVTASGAAVFQITEDQKAAIDALPEEAKVKFEYTEKDIDGGLKQLWLSSIALDN
ncbi:hypothetical protein [Paenibacillus harenae]|uniref:hypothetical protein n=1 Tax=Paenibacillus harenae TaxID=306543 RepID=UPI0027943393|nr:hypothetical protein [Paenibacillus harenae]MDQ0060967.1 type II secretory pathway pseudopilin PulG [Paenibacillus harenae]